MKKAVCLLCLVALLFSGCGSQVPPPGENEKIPLLNAEHEKIGELYGSGNLILADDSVIYTRALPSRDTADSVGVDAEYYQYIFSTKENIKLATVEKAVTFSKNPVIIDNHVYLHIFTSRGLTKGDMRLFDIDLEKHTMTQVSSEEDGFPYNSTARLEDRLLITKLETDGSSLEEYTPQTKETKTLMRFDYNEETHSGDFIRSVSTDETTISLLMLEMQSEDSYSMRIDVYDRQLNFLRSIDASLISPEENELRQGVTYFEVFNGMVYYQNLSSTRFLGKIEDDILRPIKQNMDFSKVSELTKHEDTIMFYHPLFGNMIYLLDKRDGTIRTSQFIVKSYYFLDIARDSQGRLLVLMAKQELNDDETNDEPLIFFRLSGIHFNQ